ncbi:urea transporter [Methylorubrum extorquens]|uniref:urea transporter n=1 Tax=Methylorubrum extorquens TaxID=408 RepID=UPI000158FFF2|nr:urea transporter [Methylorubrum extorquens]ABY29701.1 urea transporter [Methylorubrum extorquens PA1]KQP88701.1 urea transporter [Methylobacterium sp. Leaf119]UYW27444.1 urea transporter [Methylorubrum extorquens]WIU41019.1 urea transporter [Methylorubrum extorquens]
MPRANSNLLVQSLRGTSQVFFMENALTGVLFFAAMAYASSVTGNWATTIGAAIGVLVATLTARLLECDDPSVSSGLYGFNGVLVGAALPTFIAASPQLWASIVIGAAASTVFTAAFSATLTGKWGIPGSTGPFVLTGWLMVAAAYSFGGLHVTGDAPKLAGDVAGLTGIPALTDLVAIFFRNIAQVYLLGSAVSGVIILAGILIASVPAGIAAAAGSLISMIVAIAMGADPKAVSQGLYGFSPVLTAMAVGVVFLTPSPRVAVYAGLATVMTVFVQGALDVMVAPAGIPSFTAPYVLTMYLFIAPKKLMAPHPHGPVADPMIDDQGKVPVHAAGTAR